MQTMAEQSRRTFLASTGQKVARVVAAGAAGGLLLGQAKARSQKLLRPPGASLQDKFLSACIRCNQCVEACPTDVLTTARITSGVSTGTPYVVAREQPCNLCMDREQMECIAVCPTPALMEMTRREVQMGVAVIDHETCLPWVGVSCKACWHACPFPSEAIIFDKLGRAVVMEEECVGCGLCEHVCLTDVPAIRVVPN